MEIERDVEIEEVKDDPTGKSRLGFSSGPRASDALPAFSQDELLVGLGALGTQIRALFAPLRASERAASRRGRGGW
jgi:hypothetical protein